jgi:hypothetical protein
LFPTASIVEAFKKELKKNAALLRHLRCLAAVLVCPTSLPIHDRIGRRAELPFDVERRPELPALFAEHREPWQHLMDLVFSRPECRRYLVELDLFRSSTLLKLSSAFEGAVRYIERVATPLRSETSNSRIREPMRWKQLIRAKSGNQFYWLWIRRNQKFGMRKNG